MPVEPVKIANIYVYPLKGARGISLQATQVTSVGLEYDRRLMLVDPNGVFITQREDASLALIQPRINEDGSITFSKDGHSDFTLTPDMGSNSETELVGMFTKKGSQEREQVPVQAVGELANDWFSEVMGRPCKLVRSSNDQQRHVSTANPDYSRHDDIVSLADGMAILITNEASYESLSSHFKDDVNDGMRRFRPNIVLSGLDAWQEDALKDIGISGQDGEVTLSIVKPCARCNVMGIDQDTAQTGQIEPMQALRSQRMGKGDGLVGVFFGQNASPVTLDPLENGEPTKLGRLAVGDEVTYVTFKFPHAAVISAKSSTSYRPS